MTRDKNHVTKIREKNITETDLQVMQLLVLAHKHLNNDQDAKESREKVEKIERQKLLSKSQNLFFKKEVNGNSRTKTSKLSI